MTSLAYVPCVVVLFILAITTLPLGNLSLV
jgi:hypothetical protein